MSTPATNNKIPHILELLGPAVLLPWPARSKGDWRRWKHLQLADMSKASHLAKLEKSGNIGVALGKVSNGLVTIDLDSNDHVAPLLRLNPPLAGTLRTAASRGCNIWLRCISEYPPSCKLTDLCGNRIGEWRADGNQTIVAGTHPSGVSYEFVVEKPVITIDYRNIAWPAQSILPPGATESKRERRVEEKEVVCVGVCQQMQLYFTTDLISQTAPNDFHQNNASLFKLARLVKSYENAVRRVVTERELEAVFDRWSLIARRFWRHTRDEYYAEFLDACGYARIGLHENPIEVAVSRAKAAPLPQVQGFTDERIRLLVAICREIQEITGANPFFLPTRKLSEILGVHYTQIARWLRALEFLQIIHLAPGEVRRRGGNRSPRYHYRSPGADPHETCACDGASIARIVSPAVSQDARWDAKLNKIASKVNERL
jgi:hypothetical protein